MKFSTVCLALFFVSDLSILTSNSEKTKPEDCVSNSEIRADSNTLFEATKPGTSWSSRHSTPNNREIYLPTLSISSQDSFNIQEVLDAHNILREEVGVPPLVWSEELAMEAQSWAEKVAQKNRGDAWVLEHSGSGRGENIAGGYVTGDSPEQRVQLGWGEEEKVNFDPNTRKCIPGTVCGHYTQIIWRNTTKVGCGMAVNPNGKYILVCNYDPPGNFNNQPAY